jgi:hypothetical protein
LEREGFPSWGGQKRIGVSLNRGVKNESAKTYSLRYGVHSSAKMNRIALQSVLKIPFKISGSPLELVNWISEFLSVNGAFDID